MDRIGFTCRLLAAGLLLTLMSVAPGALAGPKDTLTAARDKSHEMFVALSDGKEFSVAKELGETTLRLTKQALDEMEYLDGVNEPNSHASDARDWMDVALREVESQDRDHALVHAGKTLKSLNAAIDAFH